MFDPSMLNKVGEIKKLAEDSKRKLDSVTVEGNGLLIITLTGNKELKSLKINADLSLISVDDLEDLLTVALKKALEAAEDANQGENEQAVQALFNSTSR
jgi:DNA-binding protein YbaB